MPGVCILVCVKVYMCACMCESVKCTSPVATAQRRRKSDELGPPDYTSLRSRLSRAWYQLPKKYLSSIFLVF